MLESLVGLGALSVVVVTVPAMPVRDPGPSPRCPRDMRLVAGTHLDFMQHVCLDARKEGRDTHCFEFVEGLSAEEGIRTDIDVCMDRFEAPNRRGAKPLVMQSFDAATAWCAKRGKRMCTEREWEFACEGSEHRPLAYGWRVDTSACNSDKKWRTFDASKLFSTWDEEAEEELGRLWQGSRSGDYPACVSPFGIYDMVGNVEEWVRARKSRRHQGALMGGFWAKPWMGCRGTNDAHDTNFEFYETGFRCCAEPGSIDAGRRPPRQGKP